jgi:hypothetical protein
LRQASAGRIPKQEPECDGVGSVAKLAMINKRNPKEVHDEFKYFSEKSAALGHNS